ncbi:DUF4132 domain-containing protein [Nocardia sp. NPDC020380]|uniref:DUF4132 domain-containing protein n=1 Tax=Nocardia sp. NPDC020380 TaxID=3364309 RepID=UPI0037B7B1E8
MTDAEPPRPVNPDATAALRAFLRRRRAAIEPVLIAAEAEGLGPLAAAARAYLDAPQEPAVPEGAAAVYALALFTSTTVALDATREREFAERFADSWILEHGHAFAAAATVWRSAIRISQHNPLRGRRTARLEVIAPEPPGSLADDQLARRVRALLATAPPDSYQATVQQLSALSADPPTAWAGPMVAALLPQPGVTETTATAAQEPKTVTTDQIRRLEAAMVDGRRWRADTHHTLIIEHPGLGDLARQLVWATFEPGGTVTGSFRVATDGMLTDVTGAQLEPSGDVLIGVAHPLHLADDLGRWQEVFADHALRQPFPQLRRSTHRFTPEESDSNLLPRFTDRQARTDRIFGLQQRGWEIAPTVLSRRVGGRYEVTVTLDPGLEGGYRYETAEQRIAAVELNGGTFGVLDPVTGSELLRQLERLAA